MSGKSDFKVSVLIPVYGVERYIRRCAESLLGQDYANMELVFVNDCTRDGSMEVLEEVLDRFPQRRKQVKIVSHAVNRGLSAARNTAVKNATGDYLLPIDSDDFLMNCHAVSELVAAAVREDADVVFYDMQLVYEDRKDVVHTYMPVDHRELMKKIIRRELILTIWGGLYRRELFTEHGICSIPGISMGEDYVVKARLAYFMHRIAYCSQPFYGYNQMNTGAITRRHFKSSWIAELEQCMNIIKDFYGSLPGNEELMEDIAVGALRGKVLLLSYCALYGGSKADFKRLNDMFIPDRASLKALNRSEKMIYWLSKYGPMKLLKNYMGIGVRTKKIMRILLTKK